MDLSYDPCKYLIIHNLCWESSSCYASYCITVSVNYSLIFSFLRVFMIGSPVLSQALTLGSPHALVISGAGW